MTLCFPPKPNSHQNASALGFALQSFLQRRVCTVRLCMCTLSVYAPIRVSGCLHEHLRANPELGNGVFTFSLSSLPAENCNYPATVHLTGELRHFRRFAAPLEHRLDSRFYPNQLKRLFLVPGNEQQRSKGHDRRSKRLTLFM